MKSRTVRQALPSASRRPRPSCWRKSVALSVGEGRGPCSISGTSTPSVEQIHSEYGVDPSIAKRDQASRRSSAGVSAETATAGMPEAPNRSAIEAGMVDAHAEAESPHRTDVGDGLSHSFDDLRGPPSLPA